MAKGLAGMVASLNENTRHEEAEVAKVEQQIESIEAAVESEEIPVGSSEMTDWEQLLKTVEDEELRELILSKRMQRRGRPRGAVKRTGRDQYAPYCVMSRKEYIQIVREIAHKEGLQVKEIIDVALKNYIDAYEARHGRVRVPKNTMSAAELIE